MGEATGEPKPFPGVFIRAPIIESLLLPGDLAAVPVAEATKVARGMGEAHEGFDVQQQGRLGSYGSNESKESPSLAIRPDAIGRAATEKTTSALQLTISVAPPLEGQGEQRKPRPPLEILATLPRLPRGAQPSVGGASDAKDVGLLGERPENDSMIVALKQGRLMCTSFHPELTSDARLHEYFIRRCVLQGSPS